MQQTRRTAEPPCVPWGTGTGRCPEASGRRRDWAGRAGFLSRASHRCAGLETGVSLRNRGDQGGWSPVGDTRCPVGVGPGPQDLPGPARTWVLVPKSVGKRGQASDATCESAEVAWAVSKAVWGGCGAGCHAIQAREGRWRLGSRREDGSEGPAERPGVGVREQGGRSGTVRLLPRQAARPMDTERGLGSGKSGAGLGRRGQVGDA